LLRLSRDLEELIFKDVHKVHALQTERVFNQLRCQKGHNFFWGPEAAIKSYLGEWISRACV